AEDGIRDLIVTGVQTCALPISGKADRRGHAIHHPWHPLMIVVTAGNHCRHGKYTGSVPGWERAAFKRRLAAGKKCVVKVASRRRSEERRVGKECRSRGA